MLDQLSQALGAVVWTMLLVLKWFHAQLVSPSGRWLADSVLPVYEESIKVGEKLRSLAVAEGDQAGGGADTAPARLPPAPSTDLQAVVREWFAVLNRNLNTFGATVLSLWSGRSYRRTAARDAAAHGQAWSNWWHTARGTFNALVEREGLTGGEAAGHGGGGGGGGGSGSGPSGDGAAAAKAAAAAATDSPFQRESSRLGGATFRASSATGIDVGDTAGSGGGGSSSRAGSRWRFWRRSSSGSGSSRIRGAGSGDGQLGGASLSGEMRRGSALFALPSGFAVSQVRADVLLCFGAVNRLLRPGRFLPALRLANLLRQDHTLSTAQASAAPRMRPPSAPLLACPLATSTHAARLNACLPQLLPACR